MLKKYFTHKTYIFLFLIILAGIFLRIYKIENNYYYSGELGKELLFIRQFALNKTLPLVGMATSHSWLYYGPFYYWLMIPVFNIFNGNPYILFCVGLVISVIGLFLNYIVVKKIADNKIALLSTLIQSISPLLIWQTRLSKLHVFFWVLMPVLMYLMYLIWNNKRKWIFVSGLVFGLLFSFHFSQIPIVGVFALLFWFKKNVYKAKDWLYFIIGTIVPNITLIWQDKNLVLWLPYRIANVTEKNPSGTFNSLSEYFGKNLFWDNKLWVVGLVVFILLFANYLYKNYKKINSDFLTFYIIISIGLMLFANILHGSSPIHYYLPVFTTVPILYSIYLSKIKSWYFIVLPIFIYNLVSFNNDPYFYKNFDKKVIGTDFVKYSTQMNTTLFILNNAGGKQFSIKRVGPYDFFPEQYSQNYKYLLLWKGGKLVDENVNLYTIIESENDINVQN